LDLYYLILGLVCTGIGIFDFIRSIVYRIDLRGFFKDADIIEAKENECFKLQLYASVVGAIMVVSLGIITVMYREDSAIFIAWMSMFYVFIHFGAKLVANLKGYIQ